MRHKKIMMAALLMALAVSACGDRGKADDAAVVTAAVDDKNENTSDVNVAKKFTLTVTADGKEVNLRSLKDAEKVLSSVKDVYTNDLTNTYESVAANSGEECEFSKVSFYDYTDGTSVQLFEKQKGNESVISNLQVNYADDLLTKDVANEVTPTIMINGLTAGASENEIKNTLAYTTNMMAIADSEITTYTDEMSKENVISFSNDDYTYTIGFKNGLMSSIGISMNDAYDSEVVELPSEERAPAESVSTAETDGATIAASEAETMA